MNVRPVAAFDVDGTLTRRDTLLPFLTRVAGRTRVAGALAVAAAGAPQRDAAKARFLRRLLRGRPHGDLEEAGYEYGTRLARVGVSEPMRARLAWHRAEGHELVIVSAALACYLEPAAAALGVDAVFATRLETDGNGRCTGRLDGGNCRGEEKARRLRAHLGTDAALVWAYGDSRGDDAMLALAAHPVRVRRGVPALTPR